MKGEGLPAAGRFGTLRGMRLARAAALPLRLAGARMRRHPLRWLLAAAGVAVAVALLGIAAGGGRIAGERAAHDLLGRIPATERRAQVTWAGGLTPGVEREARRALHAMSGGTVTSAVTLRTSRIGPHRTLAQLTGVAPLRSWLRLTSGRAPAGCTDRRCEVVQIGGAAVRDALVDPGVNIRVVGRGRLTSAVPLGFLPRPVRASQSADSRQPPIFATNDPGGLERLRGLASAYRTHVWSAAIVTAGVPTWRLGALSRRITAARSALEARDTGYTVSVPLGAFSAARARAHDAERRVALLAASAAILLLAFALLAAGAGRRDLNAEAERLARQGARRGQVGVLRVAEAAAPAAAGVLLGGAIAVAVTAARASHAGLPAGGLLARTLLGAHGLEALAACWAAAVIVIVAGGAWSSTGGRTGDVVAVAAVAAVALASARGQVSSSGLASDPLATMLPVLVCLVGGIVVLRLVPPVLRAAARAAPRRRAELRIAAVGLARAPGQPALTIAFVAVGVGVAVFALSYAGTLRRGERDAAAFRVPVDLTVTAGSDFVRPLSLAPLSRWTGLTGGGAALPVARRVATLPRGPNRVAVPLLGVPAAGLRDLRALRDGDLSASRASIAARLGSGGGLRGAALPAGAAALTVRARSTGDRVVLGAVIARRDGLVRTVPLGRTGPRARLLRAALPPADRGGRLAGLSATGDTGLLATRGHDLAESVAAPGVIAGHLTLGPVRAGGRTVTTLAGWVGRGAFRDPAGGGAAYRFDRSGAALLRPAQPTDAATLPVITDPATARDAGPDGRLALSVDDIAVPARVVGTARRFPTIGRASAGFVVAGEPALGAALDTAQPGSGEADELWLQVPAAHEAALRAALRQGPLGTLTVRSRRALQATLSGDPLARELIRILGLAGLVALALSAVGLVLAAAIQIRDESAELLDLEAQGAEPRTLRGTLRSRSALVAALGLVAGVALGAMLGRLVAATVSSTASSTTPDLPLVAVFPWGRVGLWLIAFALVSAVAILLVTRRAFSAGRALEVRTR